jgi:hypothetical protein
MTYDGKTIVVVKPFEIVFIDALSLKVITTIKSPIGLRDCSVVTNHHVIVNGYDEENLVMSLK